MPSTVRLPKRWVDVVTSNWERVAEEETVNVSVATFWGLEVMLPMPEVLEEGSWTMVGTL